MKDFPPIILESFKLLNGTIEQSKRHVHFGFLFSISALTAGVMITVYGVVKGVSFGTVELYVGLALSVLSAFITKIHNTNLKLLSDYSKKIQDTWITIFSHELASELNEKQKTLVTLKLISSLSMDEKTFIDMARVNSQFYYPYNGEWKFRLQYSEYHEDKKPYKAIGTAFMYWTSNIGTPYYKIFVAVTIEELGEEKPVVNLMFSGSIPSNEQGEIEPETRIRCTYIYRHSRKQEFVKSPFTDFEYLIENVTPTQIDATFKLRGSSGTVLFAR